MQDDGTLYSKLQEDSSDESKTVQKKVQNPLKNTEQPHGNTLVNKPSQTTKTPLTLHTVQSNAPDIEILQSGNVVLSMEQGKTKDDVAVTIIIQDLSQHPTLVLHNSFNILNEELDVPVGEATLADHEYLIIPTDMP